MKKMGWMLAVCVAFLAVAIVAPPAAQATVITFEDLKPTGEGYGTLPAGYAGFTWSPISNWITKNEWPGGYNVGTIDSVSCFGYAGADPDISLSLAYGYFDFSGAYITAAVNNTQIVYVEGWRDGSKIYDTTVTANNLGPTWFAADFDGINMLVFEPHDSGQNRVVVDNITWQNSAAVPIPPTIVLLGSTLLLGGVFFRRKF